MEDVYEDISSCEDAEYVNDVEENMVNKHNDGSVPSGPLPLVDEMRTLQTLQQFLVFSPTDLSPASTAPTMPRVACSEVGCQQSSQLPMPFLCLMVLDKPNKQTVLSLEKHKCFLDQGEGECLEEKPFYEGVRSDVTSHPTLLSSQG